MGASVWIAIPAFEDKLLQRLEATSGSERNVKQGMNFHQIVYRAAYAVMPFSAIILMGIAVFPGGLHAVVSEEEVLRHIGFDEKLNARIPLDPAFRDQEGKRVRLGDYFSGGPVILALAMSILSLLFRLCVREALQQKRVLQAVG